MVILWTAAGPCCTVRELGERSILQDAVELVVEHRRSDFEEAWTMPGRHVIRVTPLAGPVELDGERLASAVVADELPSFLAVGPEVIALVPAIAAYQGVRRDGELILGSALAPVVERVDAAARAEDHLSLAGPDSITRALALRYAAVLGAHAWFRPGGDQHLDHFLSTRDRVRTVILELSRPLFAHDVHAIEHLLETDLRFVVVRRDDHHLAWLPPVLRPTVEVPRPAPDERVAWIADRGGTRLSASAIARLLDLAERETEEAWLEHFQRVLEQAQPTRLPSAPHR